jgi:O-antigen chain-terminating methyltransferase
VATASDPRAEEIIAIANEIRDRVRARHPGGEPEGLGVPLPDLLPILHARDAAEAKVAAIGSVNPRPSGPLNAAIQGVKRTIARGLGWFVRDQVEFNHSVLNALQATLEALNEANRTFVALNGRITTSRHEFEHEFRNGVEEFRAEAGVLRGEVKELKDIRSHWIHWREEWQTKLRENEIHYLRGLSELQSTLEERFSRTDQEFKASVQRQHQDYLRALEQGIDEVQRRFWSDMEKARLEYERLIHNELRVIRQKVPSVAPDGGPPPAPSQDVPRLDYMRFADRFRGSEEYVRTNLAFYVAYFRGRENVLDIGCGRGEFLQLMQENAVQAQGVDLDGESVALCRSKGLFATQADAFAFLSEQPDRSFDGIFASQVIEHLTPDRVPLLVQLCAQKLKAGGILVLETPNPECLAIFATHFYLDPTHTRPIPPSLLVFYYEEAGLGGVEVHRLSPAAESILSLQALPEEFRNAFFGGLDYAAIGRKL